ncbi:MAG: LytR C-terminal domain-containing protein [Thermoleophilia bacterium]|nr:LytR C-terminal domain-containing protein [Thermoleophilia bacterium]
MSDEGFNAGVFARYAVVAAAGLVVGFLLTWFVFVRSDDGNVSVLPSSPAPQASTSTTGGTTVSTTAAPPAPSLPKPAEIKLAVLNGTTIAGFAAKTAARAQALGYAGVTAGNTPTTADPTAVYFRDGKRPSAQRVAKDLGLTVIKPIPATGAVATSAPAGADVVIVLGGAGT